MELYKETGMSNRYIAFKKSKKKYERWLFSAGTVYLTTIKTDSLGDQPTNTGWIRRTRKYKKEV